MAAGGPILAGGAFLSLWDLATVDDQVVVMGHDVDPDGAEGETLEAHRSPLGRGRSRLPGQAGGSVVRRRTGLEATATLRVAGWVEADFLGWAHLGRRSSPGIAPHPARALADLPLAEPSDGNILPGLQLRPDQPEDQRERLPYEEQAREDGSLGSPS